MIFSENKGKGRGRGETAEGGATVGRCQIGAFSAAYFFKLEVVLRPRRRAPLSRDELGEDRADGGVDLGVSRRLVGLACRRIANAGDRRVLWPSLARIPNDQNHSRNSWIRTASGTLMS